ncbi:hypothetical protein [Parafrankia sp. FMc2]|uniref:hypothetical protein n=1 Tax=Parafrankia sp. FMc2 TaxID=3233196 RepID=UPI0034D3ED07
MRVEKTRSRSLTVGFGVGLMLLATACGGSGSTVTSQAPSAQAAAGSAGQPPTPLAGWVTDLTTALAGGSATLLPTPAATADLAVPAPALAPAPAPAPTPVAGAGPLANSIVPEHFPFPPGVTFTVSKNKPTDATLTLDGISPVAAVDYYRQTLPSAGYKFFQEAGSDGRTKITYTGNSQSVQLVVGGSRTPEMVLLIFVQCTTEVAGEEIAGRRSDRVACV